MAKDSTWEAMYRAFLKRVTALVYQTDDDLHTSAQHHFTLKEIVDIHNKLLAERDNDDTSTDK